MYNSSEVADAIKKTAQTNKISVKQVLSEAGLGANTMSNFKTSMPKADNLAKIADVLDCSVDYLLGRTDNPQSHTGTGEISQDENKLLTCFAALNDEGKEKAIERLEEMAALDKYKKGYQPYVAKEA